MHNVLAHADTATPAVVLKFDPNVMHHGGLGAIRSLGRLGVPVYAVAEGDLAPAAQSRYLAGRFLWRPDAEQVERTQAGLLRLAETIGRTAVLIPTDDAGSIFLAEHGASLREHFRFSAPPPGLPRKVAGKASLSALCAGLGVPAPRATVPASGDEARAFAAQAGYPVIAKLTAPWQAAGRKLRSTSVVSSAAELDALYASSAEAGTGLILQERIPAMPEGDWFFHGYCGPGSAARPGFTGVKERSYPAYAGLTSFGRSAANPELHSHATALLARLGYQGIVDLDLRRDPRDGEYKLLDFNPRLGAQFRVFRDRNGLDVVIAAYLDLTGQPVVPAGQAEGRRFLVENYDPLGALRYWRDGQLGLAAWLGSVRGADEVAWFARDDLRPFGLMCARMGWRGVSRRFSGRGPERASGFAEPRYRPGRTRANKHRPAGRITETYGGKAA